MRRLVVAVVTLSLVVGTVACQPPAEELQGARTPVVETPSDSQPPVIDEPWATEIPEVPTRPTARPSATPTPTPTPTPTSAPEPTRTPEAPTPSPTLPDAPPPPSPTAPPTGSLPASLVGTEWSRIPTSQPVVALTFDAGANADGVPSILRTLAATGTPGTFFLTGRWVSSYPDLSRQIAAGHPIGNHSVSHPAFTELDDASIRREIGDAEDSISSVTGMDPRPWFRFPFGDRDARTIRLVNEAGYGSIRWTVDTLGWKGTSGGMSADAVVRRVLDTAGPGQIVLCHVGSHPSDGSTLDADALPTIIEELRARGYRFVTLPSALALTG